MPSDLDTAVRWSKRLEAALARRHGATGRGLHEKVDSVKSRLDPETVRALRLVATVRNKIVHEEGYDRIDDKRRFLTAARRAERDLGAARPRWLAPAIAVVALVVVAGVVARLVF